MTKEEALKELDTIPTIGNQVDALEMAIASLEAWEKVREEIDKQTEIHNDGEFYIKNIDVKRIIDKHLEGVADGNNN